MIKVWPNQAIDWKVNENLEKLEQERLGNLLYCWENNHIKNAWICLCILWIMVVGDVLKISNGTGLQAGSGACYPLVRVCDRHCYLDFLARWTNKSGERHKMVEGEGEGAQVCSSVQKSKMVTAITDSGINMPPLPACRLKIN